MAKTTKAAASQLDELVAGIKKKTGQDRESRPGWSFEIDGDMLGSGAREPDHWTPEQRERGVTVDFVFLTLAEHRRADGRAGDRFARFGGSMMSLPTVLIEERAYVALYRVDGKEVPADDDERERVWEALGAEGRGMCIGQYAVATAAEPEARERAAKRAAETFRVRADALALLAAGEARPLDELKRERFDLVAVLKIDGKLSWDECWNVPEPDLYDYLDACVRRAERIKQSR